MLKPWSLSSTQPLESWPLKVPHEVLAVFTRVVLKGFPMGENKANPCALHTLKSFLTSLKEAAVNCTLPCKPLFVFTACSYTLNTP